MSQSFFEQSLGPARASGWHSDLRPETAILLQRIQDEEGYVVARASKECYVGEVLTDCYACAEYRQGLMPPLVVIAVATREDFERQTEKYAQHKVSADALFKFFYKVIAE